MARARVDEQEPSRDEPPRQRLSALDRLVQQAIGSEQTVGLDSDEVATRCPKVWEWLTRLYWGKDYVLTPAVLTIRAGPEGVIGTITHRDLGASSECVVPHVADILDALEANLTADPPRVKLWGRTEPRVRKRKRNS